MNIDELTRDLTKVHPLSKSEVKRMIQEFCDAQYKVLDTIEEIVGSDVGFDAEFLFILHP